MMCAGLCLCDVLRAVPCVMCGLEGCALCDVWGAVPCVMC